MKDKRAKTLKILIDTENITTFKEIFQHIPKTSVDDLSETIPLLLQFPASVTRPTASWAQLVKAIPVQGMFLFCPSVFARG
jgi:hypothetical protein